MKSLIPYLLFLFLILCPIMHTNSWWWGGQWPWGGQYPWGIGGPWACCSRVRVQSSGLTASWQPAALGDYDRIQMRYGKPIYRKTNNHQYFLAHWVSQWRVVIR